MYGQGAEIQKTVTDIEKTSTGIEGLDFILNGGYPRNRIIFIQGGPGTGKTTLGFQFLLEGVRRGERGLYISLLHSRRDLEGIARCLAHLAVLATTVRHWPSAARLLGASESLWAGVNPMPQGVDRTGYDRVAARVMQQLDRDRYDQSLDSGRTQTVQQAVNDALQALDAES